MLPKSEGDLVARRRRTSRASFERDHQRGAGHQRDDYLVIRLTPRQLQHNREARLVHIAIVLARRRAA
jgi:hypothetical protein